MAIHPLAAVVPPPRNPTDPDYGGAWEAVQARLGVRLPPDWCEVGCTYGSGVFEDPGRLWIRVYNPFAATFHDDIRLHAANLDALKAGEGNAFVPYDVFPAPGGLLPFGSDVNGNEFFLRAGGRTDQWLVVVRSAEGVFQEFDGPLTLFLVRAFRREISVGVWPAPVFTEPAALRFRPDEPRSGITTSPRSLYTLYVENGNRAGFWAKDQSSQLGVSLYVRSIGGRAEGPLPGIPSEYGRPRVAADLYLGSMLFEADTDMSNGYQGVFYPVEPPVGAPSVGHSG